MPRRRIRPRKVSGVNQERRRWLGKHVHQRLDLALHLCIRQVDIDRWAAQVAVELRDLVLQDQLVAERVGGQLGHNPMILVCVAAPRDEHQVGRRALAKLVEELLERRIVGKVALAETLDRHGALSGLVQQAVGRAACLPFALVIRTEHHPVDSHARLPRQQDHQRAAAADLDVVGVGAEAQDTGYRQAGVADHQHARYPTAGLDPGWLPPELPGRVALSMPRFEGLLILEGVHRLPVAEVPMRQQLALGDEPLERLHDEFVAGMDVVEDLAAEREVAGVEPDRRVGERLDRGAQSVIGHARHMERLGRVDDHERADQAAGMERVQVVRQPQIGQPVGIVRQELVLAMQVGLDTHQPLADGRLRPGVGEGDVPVVDVRAQQPDVTAAAAQHEVVRGPLLVVEEVLLDDLALVAQAEDELLVAEIGVVLHEMPQDRSVADLHHRLGHRIAVLANAHALSAAEEDDLHSAQPCDKRAVRIGHAPVSVKVTPPPNP